MANHLEQLIAEWLEFKGYFVRRNVQVGPLAHGGHACELDIIAYHPMKKHVLQIEPSLDSHTWSKRERRFKKKFTAGNLYIPNQVFPWMGKDIKIVQWAVINVGDKTKHKTIGGGEIHRVSEIYRMIADDLLAKAKIDGIHVGIPEQFMLLRTLQHGLRWIPEMTTAP